MARGEFLAGEPAGDLAEHSAGDPAEASAAVLAADLAADLGVVLGRDVTPADLTGRRDGACAPLVGLLCTTSSARRETAARLLTEWGRAGSARPVDPCPVAAPMDHLMPGLAGGGARLFPGLRLHRVPDGTGPALALERLVAGAAVLVGGLPAVTVADGGRLEQLPGWVARLQMLTRQDRLGPPPEGAADEAAGRWAALIHETAARVFVAEAAEDSVWTLLLDAVRAQAAELLRTCGAGVDGDLYRRDSAGFDSLVDLRSSAVLDEHPLREGQVVQVIRPPYSMGGRVQRGAVLFAPGG